MKIATSFAMLLASVLIQACSGSDPAGFASSGKNRDAPKTKPPVTQDGNKADGSGAGDDDGDDDDGGGGEESDSDSGLDSDGPSNPGADADAGAQGEDPRTDQVNADGLTVDEGEIVAKTPGVEVVKVGVNFEDLGFSNKNDRDYNDAVLCFDGKFKVENASIVSIRKQEVKGTTFSASGCKHKVKVEITHKDGSKEPALEFDSRATTPVTMRFKVGSKMEVFMTPYDGCNPGVKRDMKDPKHAQVKPNVCNQSGN